MTKEGVETGQRCARCSFRCLVTLARLVSRRGLILADRSPSEAADAQRRAYDWAREAIGDDKRETLLFRVSLAVALRRAGKEDEAVPLVHGALEQLEGALRNEHADIADIHGILGSDALWRDDYNAAVKHFDRALEIWGDEAGSSYSRAPLQIGGVLCRDESGAPGGRTCALRGRASLDGADPRNRRRYARADARGLRTDAGCPGENDRG